MRIRFEDTSPFQSGNAEVYTQLQRLFLRAARGQHALDIADPHEVLASDFMHKATSDINRLEWTELVTRTTTVLAFAPAAVAGKEAVVSSSAREPTGTEAFVLAPGDVGEWAEQPLRVLLENARDEVLVLLAIRVTASPRLDQALQQGWLKPEGRGGSGEVRTAVKNAQTAHRIFVLVDSDRVDATAPEVDPKHPIRRACEEARIPAHILYRRELENYIPSSIWKMLIGTPRTKAKGSKGVDHRTVLVYRWLLRVIDEQGADAFRHGKDALEQVKAMLEKKAQRKIPALQLVQFFSEWEALSLPGKKVDDLKVRFGAGLAERAVEHLRNEKFDAKWLDSDAQAEFHTIAAMIEEWL